MMASTPTPSVCSIEPAAPSKFALAVFSQTISLISNASQ
jgi:hypothetical protein